MTDRAIPLKPQHSAQRHFFRRHAPRLLTSSFTPTCSWDVDSYGLIILLAQIPVVLLDKQSPGDYQGQVFHYAGHLICTDEMPGTPYLSEVLHDLMEYELNPTQLKDCLIDSDLSEFHSLVSIETHVEEVPGGYMQRFMFSFRVTDAAMLEFANTHLMLMQDIDRKLEELGKTKQSAIMEAGKVIASLNETKH